MLDRCGAQSVAVHRPETGRDRLRSVVSLGYRATEFEAVRAMG